MGHSTKGQFDPCYNFVIYLDTQSAYLGQPLQNDLVKVKIGMAAHHNLRAAQAPSSFSSRHQERVFGPQYANYFKEQPRVDIAAQLASIKDESHRPPMDDLLHDRQQTSRYLRALSK